jgi:DNA repair exonuclease SbcCD ATPase subunit
MSKHDLTADTLNDIYRQLYPDTKMKAQLSAAQERIEDMHLQILDLNESRHDLIQKADNLAKEVKEYRLAASAHRIAREHADGAQARCTQMESDVKRLTEDLSTLQKNYNHVFELQKAKDSTIREAMRIVEEMRDKVKKSDEYKKDADKYKDQAEHLARQTIRLTDEKRKLIEDVEKLRTDYVSLMASFKEIKDQVPDLIEENNKFREQTVRLVNEKASTTCEGSKNGNPKSSCGVCAACKLQQTQSILNQTVINFEAVKGQVAELERRLEKAKRDDAYIKDLQHQNNVLAIRQHYYRKGLKDVADSFMWSGKKIAQDVLLQEKSVLDLK